jgi:hypothetical protein
MNSDCNDFYSVDLEMLIGYKTHYKFNLIRNTTGIIMSKRTNQRLYVIILKFCRIKSDQDIL